MLYCKLYWYGWRKKACFVFVIAYIQVGTLVHSVRVSHTCTSLIFLLFQSILSSFKEVLILTVQDLFENQQLLTNLLWEFAPSKVCICVAKIHRLPLQLLGDRALLVLNQSGFSRLQYCTEALSTQACSNIPQCNHGKISLLSHSY